MGGVAGGVDPARGTGVVAARAGRVVGGGGRDGERVVARGGPPPPNRLKVPPPLSSTTRLLKLKDLSTSTVVPSALYLLRSASAVKGPSTSRPSEAMS